MIAGVCPNLLKRRCLHTDRHKITKIDRKQRRQIDEKKLAQGMKLE